MKSFNYKASLRKLGFDLKEKLNLINYDKIPKWVRGEDFLQNYLPYLVIIGDSREQNVWIEKACGYYGITFIKAKKGNEIDNLKEGDYTYELVFGNNRRSYIGEVAYERKGAISEFYTNCTGYRKENKTSDRERISREFDRFTDKQYKKIVLLLEFGESLTDLIDLSFEYYNNIGLKERKNVGTTLFTTIMSWKQPNCKDFDIIQSNSHEKLFWLFIIDSYYYFRNDIKNIIKEKEENGFC